MTIKEFIETAIEGGWKEGYKIEFKMTDTVWPPYLFISKENLGFCIMPFSEVIIDPEAWKAVGKVKGWDKGVCFACGKEPPCWCDCSDIFPPYGDVQMLWLWKMCHMIPSLADGKTLEDYIATL